MSAANITACPTCHQFGFVLDQRQRFVSCPTCGGKGAAAYWARQWWSWQHPLDRYSILERRMEHTVRVMVNALLFIFTGLGLWFGGQAMFRAISNGDLLAVLLTRSWTMTVFWFGVLCGLYLLFRLERELQHFRTIPTPEGPDTQPLVSAWGSENQRDIATVCTEPTLRILEHAWHIAEGDKRQAISPAHVLTALSTTPMIASMLVRLGIDPGALRKKLQTLDNSQPSSTSDPVLAGAVRALVTEAFTIAATDGRTRITPVHLVAAYGKIEDPVHELLFDLGVDDQKLQRVVRWLALQDDLRHRLRRYQSRASLKPKGAIDRGYTAAATPMLNQFSTDLTLAARNNRLPYIVGREAELASLFRIIESNRRSVIIVGDSGVGKSSILYALAERMVSEDVPDMLQDKRLVSLSPSMLVAGAGGMGQLEGRLEHIMAEISRAGNIVLAIENIDQLVGAASSGGQGLDAAQIIAQGLWDHLCIAVATANVKEYRQFLEHGTLLSAFEKIDLNEMDQDQSLAVLQSRVGGIEFKQKVYFSFEALEKAVALSDRYLHDKTLPGKALELLEEAAVAARKAHGPNAIVAGADVASVISERTNVQVSDVTADEQQKLLDLEPTLHQRIIGQNEAVTAVANALRRARAELRDTNRPIANLLFLGPTGVGKTELAKALASVYFGSEEAMIRVDMSEYQDVASISRLIGAPPGYAGSTAGGYLTEAVRTKPFSLVLLDELEKAHPDVLNLFLQVMDDGRLTDSNGRTIDFTNVILIATSNAGSQHIQNRMREGADVTVIKEELLTEELQHYFKPEFLNRFDSVIVFTPLQANEVEQIVGLMIAGIAKRLTAKGITFQASPEAIAELAASGFDPLSGARPLRRLVQEKVDNALADFMLRGKLGRRDVAVLDVGGTIRVEQAKAI